MITKDTLVSSSIAYCLANPHVHHSITEAQLKGFGITQADLVQQCTHAGIQTRYEAGKWVLWGGKELLNGHETNTP
jgi:hypothetical protein